MAKIRHIAISAEDPFATAQVFKQAFGLQVDDLDGAEARARQAGATPQPPPKVDLSKLGGRIFFEKKYTLAGVKFDFSAHGWPVAPENK